MKKKLKIDQLRVTSFVTAPEENEIRGGGHSDLCGTNASCYRYISCFEFQCVVHSYQDPCWRDAITKVRTC